MKLFSDKPVTISAPGAKAKNLILHYGPQRIIWFCAMGHSAGFGYGP
jgi:hypothetical protein